MYYNLLRVGINVFFFFFLVFFLSKTLHSVTSYHDRWGNFACSKSEMTTDLAVGHGKGEWIGTLPEKSEMPM